ncbi:PREDICTED: putative uncharacterized protein DDB_G0294196 [Trachymyrmex septentrionalis]|uniref:putative uncharacterized protein DDB_G0294196 n=1 Tax=Trachymyrmex septentrionalis TaxID=34720 RepID=UPI00084F1750|nr:PREDICTED: putative uncharacterized protein DDB_G0294196 [Trachymyrmex septentrionalis]
MNADALSRNPVNLEEVNCKPINPNRSLNLDNPEDLEMVSRMLKETDEEEEDENFELYLSDNEEDEGQMPDNNVSDENTDSIPFTHEELCESPRLQITEEALIHEPSNYNQMQTRSQTKRRRFPQEILLQENENKIEVLENRNDPPDKGKDIEENASTDNEDDESDKNSKNQSSEIKITKDNVINSRDLLFLRRDNVAYFVDTNGRPLDSGSQKLFERNEIPCLGDLTVGQAKAIKYKKHYHIALPVSEGQREGWLRSRAYRETRKLLDEEYKRYLGKNRPVEDHLPPLSSSSPSAPPANQAKVIPPPPRTPSPPQLPPSPPPRTPSPAFSDALTERIFPDTPPQSSESSHPISPRRSPSPTNSTDSVEFLEEILPPPPRSYFRILESDTFESLISQFPRVTAASIPQGAYTIGPHYFDPQEIRNANALVKLQPPVSPYSFRIPPMQS